MGTASTPTLGERLYGAVATVGSAVARLGARAYGASRADLEARRGELPRAASPLLWFHGASAGEMAAAANLVTLLRGAGFSFTAGFTTTNEAGVDWLRRRSPAGAVVSLAPWDAPRHVERAFDCWQPRALFLVETEIWPWLVLAAARRRVPLFCVSARIYPRDVPRYRLARQFLAPTFGRITAVLAQSETERARFSTLGVPAERCFVAGNLKHLTPAEAEDPAGDWERERGLVVCGSIHRDEIAGLFTALEGAALGPASGGAPPPGALGKVERDLRARLAAVARVASRRRVETRSKIGFHPLASRIVVAPRHEDGAALAVQEAQRRGWPVARRSQGSAATGWRVLVLDTMGELARFYRRAEVAVVGGGFADHGGHNPYEPVCMGAPVLFGVHFDHFEAEARSLAAAAPESRVNDWSALAARLRDCLGDEDGRRDLFRRQAGALPDPTAIGERYLEILSRWLVPSALAAAPPLP